MHDRRPTGRENERRCGCGVSAAFGPSLPSVAMGASTTTVEIDTALLERLRDRAPGKTDRELLEDLATVTLGFETIRRAQERNVGADEDEVLNQAVEAVHEVRDEMAQRRAG
jgi:hypothetical protein